MIVSPFIHHIHYDMFRPVIAAETFRSEYDE
jgi:hypothetical protein